MYFTHLVRLSKNEEFDFSVLQDYEYFAIINLGEFFYKISEDLLKIILGKAKVSKNTVYVYCEPNSGMEKELINLFKKDRTIIMNLDVERPFILSIRIKDLLISKEHHCEAQIAYIEDYYEESQVDFEEELNPFEYAVSDAFNNIFDPLFEKERMNINKENILDLIKLLVTFVK
jgi:hypothetical protein